MKSLIVILFLFSTTAQAMSKSCRFEMKANSHELTWTAFKTTDKLGVPGTFDKFEVTKLTSNSAKSLESWLKSHSFQVDVASVNTKNPPRDKTLKEKFFDLLINSLAKMKSGIYISGKVKPGSKIEDGKFTGLLSLNGVEKEVPFTYSFKENLLELNGSIDLMDFGLKKAYDSLHKACFDLHKGTDGVSKTWTQVDLNGKVQLQKICN